MTEISEPLIDVRNLTKIFSFRRGKFKALDEVNLKVYRGDFLTVLGHSGSGKSTLLNILGGLERPTSGTVMLDGEDLSKVSENRLAQIRRTSIGFIFQTFNLIPSLTAFENIETALIPTTQSEKERESKISSLLKVFEIPNKADHFPLELCAGEQQRVAIARALANNPELILADEPTGELDPEAGLKVAEFLLNLNKEKKVTIILATVGVFPIKTATEAIMKKGRLVATKNNYVNSTTI